MERGVYKRLNGWSVVEPYVAEPGCMLDELISFVVTWLSGPSIAFFISSWSLDGRISRSGGPRSEGIPLYSDLFRPMRCLFLPLEFH